MNGKTKWIAALCLLPFIVLFGAFQIARWCGSPFTAFQREQRLGMGQLCRYSHLAVLPAGLSVLAGDPLWSSVYGLLIALVGSYSRQLGQT